MKDVLAGVYRHYKGPLYLVFGLAHDANAGELYDAQAVRFAAATGDASQVRPLEERTVVLYIGLELDEAHTGPRLAIRTAETIGDAFFDRVHMGQPDQFTEGTVCEGGCWFRALNQDGLNNHISVPRFEYLGPTWEGIR